jgi:hypothetical protein
MFLKRLWDERPLGLILLLAAVFRILAAFFAKGWGMFDDHFIAVESAQSWVDGFDYNAWLPWSPGNHGPTGHNFFYPLLNFLFFSLMKFLHISDPQVKMTIMRLILAAWSMITVYCGYRITESLGGKVPARMAGILLALFWFMPWMGVRNLVEMVCVPFIMLAFWVLVKPFEKNRPFLAYFIAGLFLGLATGIRLQTVFFPIGLGAWLLFSGRFRNLFGLAAGSVLSFTLVEGGIDFFLWGKPFIELYTYATTSFTERNDYISLPWYDFFLVLAGMLIPPVSLFLGWGFIRNWKKYLFIFIPLILFFVFHSWVPNKQERFIVPMVPLFIVLGSIGWTEFREGSKFWGKHRQLLKACWIFFWILNSAALLVFTFTYSKRSMAESMTYLSKYPGIVSIAAVDGGNNPEMFPKFYLGQWVGMANEKTGDRSLDSILTASLKKGRDFAPRFVLFTTDSDLDSLVIRTRKYLPQLVYETEIKPGFIDRLVRWLNPINRNKTVYIYRNREFYPEKIR